MLKTLFMLTIGPPGPYVARTMLPSHICPRQNLQLTIKVRSVKTNKTVKLLEEGPIAFSQIQSLDVLEERKYKFAGQILQ